MTIVKHAFAIAKLRERDNNKKKKKEMLCEYRIGKSSHKMNEKKKKRENTIITVSKDDIKLEVGDYCPLKERKNTKKAN